MVNTLNQSIFQLSENHQDLLKPASIQGFNKKVFVALRFYGVQGAPNVQSTIKGEDGKNYNLIIAQVQGTEEVEEVREGDEVLQRYAPLRGYFSSPLHLPEETFDYLGDSFPIPPETNATILLSDEDLDLLERESQTSVGVIQKNKGEYGKTQNAWVLRVEVDLYQAVTILSTTDRDGYSNAAKGFRNGPSILIKEPIKLVPGENIMAYTNLKGLNFPYTRLTVEELNNPLIKHLIGLISGKREYGFNQSVANGTRALTPAPRNKNLPPVSQIKGTGNPLVRTETPTPPVNFLGDDVQESEVPPSLVTSGSPSSKTFR